MGSSESAKPESCDVDQVSEDTSSSVMHGVQTLIEDGRNYAEAELAYQKSRLNFAANNGRSGLIFLTGALAFFHFGLMALVVGTMIGLMPVFGVWGAVAIVGLGLLLIAIICAIMAKNHFGRISDAFRSEDGDESA